MQTLSKVKALYLYRVRKFRKFRNGEKKDNFIQLVSVIIPLRIRFQFRNEQLQFRNGLLALV